MFTRGPKVPTEKGVFIDSESSLESAGKGKSLPNAHWAKVGDRLGGQSPELCGERKEDDKDALATALRPVKGSIAWDK